MQSGFDVRDPVCGMEVRADEAVGESEFEGTTYYFCSADCKEQFDAMPTHFIGGPQEHVA